MELDRAPERRVDQWWRGGGSRAGFHRGSLAVIGRKRGFAFGGAIGVPFGVEAGLVVAGFFDRWGDEGGERRGAGESIVSAAFGGGIGVEDEVGCEVGRSDAEDDQAGGLVAVGEGGAESGRGSGVGEHEDGRARGGVEFQPRGEGGAGAVVAGGEAQVEHKRLGSGRRGGRKIGGESEGAVVGETLAEIEGEGGGGGWEKD